MSKPPALEYWKRKVGQWYTISTVSQQSLSGMMRPNSNGCRYNWQVGLGQCSGDCLKLLVITSQEAIDALWKWFEPESKKELYTVELQTQMKRRNEDWSLFGNNIKQLVEKAYPKLAEEARESLLWNNTWFNWAIFKLYLVSNKLNQ